MKRAGCPIAAEEIAVWGPDSWDPLECERYIVEEVGNTERFPAYNPYNPGFVTLLHRLKERYGEDYIKSAARVLRDFLEDLEGGSPEEQALWHEWRMTQAERVSAQLA
ncbi:MAG: hypothetical protein LQ345_002750 [Seirophora villosa]|nr:MAG: hypothetical protein LQ345_002750 [Seirophora villosa]